MKIQDQFNSLRHIAEEYSDYENETKIQELLSYLKECKFYLAIYQRESYEGESFVLFEREGKLYEVHATHCSCYGLENQWNPEETSWSAIAIRDYRDTNLGSRELHDYIQRLCRAPIVIELLEVEAD